MALNELLDELEIPLDHRLQQFSYAQLLAIVDVLTKRMRIRDLAQLVADSQHFTLKNLFRALERLEDGSLLLQLLNEPLKAQELHQTIEHWLSDQELQAHTLHTMEPSTCILGWKSIGLSERGFTRMWQTKEIWAVEANLKRSQNSVEHAFSQARHLTQSAQYCYVTITPYLWYKYSEIIKKTMERSKNIGTILLDRSRVIKVLATAQRNDIDKTQYSELKSALE
jgi:hypothetical protein